MGKVLSRLIHVTGRWYLDFLRERDDVETVHDNDKTIRSARYSIKTHLDGQHDLGRDLPNVGNVFLVHAARCNPVASWTNAPRVDAEQPTTAMKPSGEPAIGHINRYLL